MDRPYRFALRASGWNFMRGEIVVCDRIKLIHVWTSFLIDAFGHRWLKTPAFGLWLAQQETIVQDVLHDNVGRKF